MARPKGTLIIIGGNEDKDTEGECVILHEVARRVKPASKHLVLLTVASQLPAEVADDYTAIFKKLGVVCKVVDVRTREDATCDEAVAAIKSAAVVFMTGGDQLRITSQIGDSPVFQTMRDLYHAGGTLVGTSAGAAAMSATMILGGPGDKTLDMSALYMAPGLGFLAHSVIDSHFAERGRMGRLVTAVAQNPANLGLGIDEDTAIVVERERTLRVIGSGAVYVVDGAQISYSSLSEEHAHGIITIHNACFHVLGHENSYDLIERAPIVPRQPHGHEG